MHVLDALGARELCSTTSASDSYVPRAGTAQEHAWWPRGGGHRTWTYQEEATNVVTPACVKIVSDVSSYSPPVCRQRLARLAQAAPPPLGQEWQAEGTGEDGATSEEEAES